MWVNPDQLFRPAQNLNISIASCASNLVDHFSPIQGLPGIGWCINQFANVISGVEKNDQCKMAADQADGNLFDNFRDYFDSYFNAGSNSDDSSDFYPFPFAGLGVAYDPCCQARLEASSTEAELSAILPSLIGTSEFVYSIPKYGQSNADKVVLDAVYSPAPSICPPAEHLAEMSPEVAQLTEQSFKLSRQGKLMEIQNCKVDPISAYPGDIGNDGTLPLPFPRPR